MNFFFKSLLRLQHRGHKSIYPSTKTYLGPGNEKADEAAEEASTNNNTPNIELSSLKDAIRYSVERSKRAHQQLWDQESNNKLH